MIFERPVIRQHRQRVFARLDAEGRQHVAIEWSYAAEEPTAALIPLPVDMGARVGFAPSTDYPFFSQLNRAFPEPAMPNPETYQGSPYLLSGKLPWSLRSMGKFSAETEAFLASLHPAVRPGSEVIRVEVPEGWWRICPFYFSIDRNPLDLPWFPLLGHHGDPEPLRETWDMDCWLYVQGHIPEQEVYDYRWEHSRFELGIANWPERSFGVVTNTAHGYRMRIEGKRPNEDHYLVGSRDHTFSSDPPPAEGPIYAPPSSTAAPDPPQRPPAAAKDSRGPSRPIRGANRRHRIRRKGGDL